MDRGGRQGADDGPSAGQMSIQQRAPSTVEDRDFRSRERGFVGLGIRRRPTSQQITEARGPAACLRRDALFRRLLLGADVVAIAGTFVLVTQLSSRSLQLTWLSLVGLPLLLAGAKLFGLYDRDETLLRKRTL